MSTFLQQNWNDLKTESKDKVKRQKAKVLFTDETMSAVHKLQGSLISLLSLSAHKRMFVTSKRKEINGFVNKPGSFLDLHKLRRKVPRLFWFTQTNKHKQQKYFYVDFGFRLFQENSETFPCEDLLCIYSAS